MRKLLLTSLIYLTPLTAKADLFYSGYSVHGVNAHITYQGTTIYGGDGLITLSLGVPAWCVDVSDWLLSSGDFTVSPASQTWMNEVSALATLAGPNDTPQFDAAIQAAIWLTALPGAEITPDDSSVMPLAEQLLSEPLSPGGPLDILTQVGNQTLVTRAVAEPMSLAILGMGLFGLGLIRQQKG
jgi:hypothetical protein